MFEFYNCPCENAECIKLFNCILFSILNVLWLNAFQKLLQKMSLIVKLKPLRFKVWVRSCFLNFYISDIAVVRSRLLWCFAYSIFVWVRWRYYQICQPCCLRPSFQQLHFPCTRLLLNPGWFTSMRRYACEFICFVDLAMKMSILIDLFFLCS